MRTSFQFLLYFLLLSAMIFSQNRTLKTNKSNLKKLQPNLIKSERCNWKDTFKAKQFYESNTDEKTINKNSLENGFLLTEDIWQYWYDLEWRNSEMESYKYDENNNQTEWLHKWWNGSTWDSRLKYSSTYDKNNNQTEWLSQQWDGSTWRNLGKDSYTYDENNNLTEELDQSWDVSAWVNRVKYSYTYDGNNNRTEYLNQYWENSTWVNDRKHSYKYIPLTKIKEDLSLINSYSLSNNYPNPFNPTTNIKYSIASRQFVELKVFNVLGQEIETLINEEKASGNYEIEFNAANLPSGVYFYRIQAGSFCRVKKMLLIK